MIRERDGVHVDLGGDRTLVADARSATGDVTFVSHAHADHAPRNRDARVVCSRETAALVAARTGVIPKHVESTPGVELFPSGHVVGSRAARFTAADGRRVLYTGDVSTRDRLHLDGFEPVDADVLVVESTYGKPTYRFPEQAVLEGEIRDWIRDNDDRPLFLFGYSLGRAQKLQGLARAATARRLVVHPAVKAVNEAIEATTDYSFPATSLAAVDDLAPEDVLVAPPSAGRSKQFERLADRLDPLTAGFSGWAVEDSYYYRTGHDAVFPLSDHCDFDELLALVEAVDPETVYTNHGFAEEFAGHLSQRGYHAVALKRNQSRLDEF